jgi:hypothetical protein
MTIYQIKKVIEKSSTPEFFTRKTLKAFNQTLKDFKITKYVDEDYHITAPIKNSKGEVIGKTERRFRPGIGEFIDLRPYGDY